MKLDILTFGSITVDIIICVPEEASVKLSEKGHEHLFQIPGGEKIRIENSIITCGGGAANSSVGFSKLGLKSALCGVIGDQAYHGFIQHELKKNKVNMQWVTRAKNSNSSFSMILNFWTGERTVLHKRTEYPEFGVKTLQEAPQARALYIGHLYDHPAQILDYLPKRKAQYHEIIGWNPGKTQFKKGFKAFTNVFPSIDILVLNVEEAERFTHLKASKQDYFDPEKFGEKLEIYEEYKPKCFSDVREIGQKFLKAGVKTVVITDGGHGAQIFEGDFHYFAPSAKAERVDTLGAGDAFSVGFLAARLHGKSLPEQITWAAKNSASVIQQFGAQAGQLRLEDLEE